MQIADICSAADDVLACILAATLLLAGIEQGIRYWLAVMFAAVVSVTYARLGAITISEPAPPTEISIKNPVEPAVLLVTVTNKQEQSLDVAAINCVYEPFVLVDAEAVTVTPLELEGVEPLMAPPQEYPTGKPPAISWLQSRRLAPASAV